MGEIKRISLLTLIFIFLSRVAAQTLVESDAIILAEICNACGHSEAQNQWTNCSVENVQANFCSWYGIICIGNRIAELYENPSV